jgi:Trp operon repressor
MDAKEFSHLSKADLLELMLEMSKENDALKKRLKIYEKVVEDNRIQIEESGSIAEAALKINGVFEAAQAAADQYLDNIRRMESELQEELQKAKAENGAE